MAKQAQACLWGPPSYTANMVKHPYQVPHLRVPTQAFGGAP